MNEISRDIARRRRALAFILDLADYPERDADVQLLAADTASQRARDRAFCAPVSLVAGSQRRGYNVRSRLI